MKELPFCYKVIKGSVCGESYPEKFHKQKFHQCKKCSEQLTNEDIIPLEFFEMLAKDYMKDYKCDKNKTFEMYKEVLKEYPFCISKDDELIEDKYKTLDKIMNNKKFNEEEKFLRLTAVFLNLIIEYITSKSMDIGSLSHMEYSKNELMNTISEDYIYYKESIEDYNSF